MFSSSVNSDYVKAKICKIAETITMKVIIMSAGPSVATLLTFWMKIKERKKEELLTLLTFWMRRREKKKGRITLR